MVKHAAMMEHAISDHCVAEYGGLLAHRTVTGHHDASPLVATRDQLEEQVSRVRLERQIPQLVS
jgi:hypothetical protein